MNRLIQPSSNRVLHKRQRKNGDFKYKNDIHTLVPFSPRVNSISAQPEQYDPLLSTKQASSISNSFHNTEGPRTYGLCWATNSTSRLTTRVPCLNKFEDFLSRPSLSQHSAGSLFLLKA